jgi:hypothetical protein
MKTKMYFFSVCLLLAAFAAPAEMKGGQVVSGNSLTDFGTYTIVESQTKMVVDNQAVPTYELIYENTSKPLQIGVIKEKKCTSFLVRSGEFEVQYACVKNVFGVKKMDIQYRELPEEEFNSKLSKTDFYAQRVISQKPKTEEELLGLIACYFPNLVDPQYHALF